MYGPKLRVKQEPFNTLREIPFGGIIRIRFYGYNLSLVRISDLHVAIFATGGRSTPI